MGKDETICGKNIIKEIYSVEELDSYYILILKPNNIRIIEKTIVGISVIFVTI